MSLPIVVNHLISLLLFRKSDNVESASAEITRRSPRLQCALESGDDFVAFLQLDRNWPLQKIIVVTYELISEPILAYQGVRSRSLHMCVCITEYSSYTIRTLSKCSTENPFQSETPSESSPVLFSFVGLQFNRKV